MRRLYEEYSSAPALRQLVAEVPWGHHLVLLGKLSEPA